MTPELLGRCGKALFGASWQSELSRALGVADRTVRRWAAGTSPVPESVAGEIAKLLSERGADIETLLRELHRPASD